MNQAASRSLISSRMPSLDSLRGLAILMVVLFHAYQGFNWIAFAGRYWGRLLQGIASQGTYGVHLFFLLSGFLIGTALLKSRKNRDYYKNFYIKRFLRILPVYLVMIVVLKIWMPVTWNFVVASTLFLANYARLFGAHNYEYGSLWSLAVEEHFYLVWPTCIRRFSDRTLLYLLCTAILLEPLLRLTLLHVSRSIDITFKTTFVIDNIAYGALLALLIHTGKLTVGNARRCGLALLGIGAPLVLLMLWFNGNENLGVVRSVPWVWMCAGLLLLGIERDSRAIGSEHAHRSGGVLPFFGYISYGLYLVNQFINDKLGAAFNRIVAPAARGSLGVYTARAVVCISTAVAIAYLSRKYFEAPMLALKDRLTSHAQPKHQEAAT